MKYTNVPAFKKHIESAYQKEMPILYLALAENAYERGSLLDYILCYLPHPNAFSVFRFAGAETDSGQIITALASPSLFGGKPLVIIDDIAALKKEALTELLDFIRFPFDGYLVMGAAGRQPVLAICREVEKLGIVIDIMYEKPWEKESRLTDFMAQECARARKSADMAALAKLLELIGPDMSALFREIGKLVAYTGERARITVEDVLALCGSAQQITVWQVAEELVWHRRLQASDEWDAPFFHSLIAALRYQLQLGLKIAAFAESGKPFKDVEKHFVKIHPKSFARKREIAEKLGTGYFKKGLNNLLAIDLLSKNSAVSLPALLTLFFCKSMEPELSNDPR